MDFRKIKEGEFWRLSETGQLVDYTLCESMADIDKFQLIARLKNERVIYSVRHGRNDSLRTWRLDVMAKALKQRGITEFTVKMVEGLKFVDNKMYQKSTILFFGTNWLHY